MRDRHLKFHEERDNLPEDGIGQAAEWRDHGMRYLVVCNVSILQPSLRKGLAATAPFFKILRGLKKL